MKYRTKLYLAFLGVTLSSLLLALTIVYVQAREYLFKELQSEVVSIASTLAANIDVDLIEQIHSHSDETSDAYHQLQMVLQKARNTNRRSDIYAYFVYTLYQSSTNPNEMYFGVDAETGAQQHSHAGDIYPDTESDDLPEHLFDKYSPNRLSKDPWGEWLTGYAPILDKKGHYVATLGVDIKASSVRASLRHLLILEIPSLLFSLAMALIFAAILSRRATVALGMVCSAIEEIGQGNFNRELNLKTKDEFHTLGLALNRMAKGLKEREHIKSSFVRYVSRDVLEKILQTGLPARLEGERRKVTLLFSDIRHFTTLAEKLPPEKVVALLNEYFERMLTVIFNNHGTLDKFIGDGMMAEFGAPLDDPNQERNAVLAALEMQKALKNLCDKWAIEGKPILEMGIGIHTGAAIVGNIGSQQHMDYTAIGDSVNVASRLEQATKTLKTPIIVSETTFQAVQGEFVFKDLGLLTLHGRESPVHAYALLSD